MIVRIAVEADFEIDGFTYDADRMNVERDTTLAIKDRVMELGGGNITVHITENPQRLDMR